MAGRRGGGIPRPPRSGHRARAATGPYRSIIEADSGAGRHHSAADTLDKVNPKELAEATAALAWVAWALAEAPETLPRPEPPDKPP